MTAPNDPKPEATGTHVLVVEDEQDLQELLRYNLTREGYRVTVSGDGEEALDLIRRPAPAAPDLVILDLMLPGMNGLEVCRAVRADPALAGLPIVMLTAKGTEADVVVGLELGADDYVTKPFSPRVLMARVRAVLRRRMVSVADDAPVRLHDLVIHPGRHEVLVQGRAADLTSTEFRLLQHLARRPGWVFTRNQIIDAIHGSDYPATERSVDVLVVGLRRKLGAAGKDIETVRGVGYRFRE